MSPFTPRERTTSMGAAAVTRYVTLFCRRRKKHFLDGAKQPLLVPAILPSSSLKVVVVKVPANTDEDILVNRLNKAPIS